MKLNRALTVVSSFMEPEPERLRLMAHTLADRQGAKPSGDPPPLSVPFVKPEDATVDGALDASLAAMQASHGLLTRAIDMLK